MSPEMSYEEAVARLRNHSNLNRGADDRSLLYALWQADRQGSALDLAAHVKDVLACLAVVNVDMNDPRPSETGERQNPEVIVEVAYLVSGLIVGLLQEHRRWSISGRLPASALEAVRDAALRIGMAWDMVLAGDHADLIEDLELEWDARPTGERGS